MFGWRKRKSSDNSEAKVLVNGATVVGCLAPGDSFEVRQLSDPTLCFGPSRVCGVCFLFHASEGKKGKMYFFPDFASAWIDGEPAPRAQIPVEMIEDIIPGFSKALNALFAKQLRHGESLDRMIGLTKIPGLAKIMQGID